MKKSATRITTFSSLFLTANSSGIDSIGSNSHTEKSLLEETASWQWILNQPVKHKYLPKELVPPEIAHTMAGYGFEEY